MDQDADKEAVERREVLHDTIVGYIYSRSSWETNQAIWYQMRHDGVGRKNPPWPGAANLHFPLADTQITQLKPFYWRQIYSNELVASFVPYKQEEEDLSAIAEQWFNYQIRYSTNLFRESQVFIDKMLMAGSSVCKVIFDHDKQRVSYDAIDPLSFIISPQAKTIQDADLCVHVIKMTEEEYRRHDDYNQDEDFIKSLLGSVTFDEADKQQLEQLKRIREGFTVTADNNQIIIWEAYSKDIDGKWTVYTYSPRQPEEDVKAPYELPYDHGLAPFVEFDYEIKEKGFYSSRGIPCLVAMEETYLTKLMNEKYDVITLVNRPIYTLVGNPIPNMENVMLRPGSILPYEVKAIQNPPPPLDFDKEMMLVRENAQQRVATPDMGMSSINNGKIDNPTAKQVSYVENLSASTSDIRSAIFRDSLTRVYQMTWSLYQQYKPDSFKFYYREEMKDADEKMLDGEYLIQPSGSVDSYNRSFQIQKAQALFQMFNNDPFVKQDELRKNLMESMDPRLITKLFQDTEQANAGQQEDQASECLLIEQGFPAQVKPTDDHVVHVQTVIHRLQMLQQVGPRPNPIALKLYFQHVNDHLFMFKAQKGKQAPEADQLEIGFKQAMAPFIPKSPYRNGGQTGATPMVTQGAGQ